MKIRLPIPLNPHYGYMKSEEATQIIEYLKKDIEMTEELVRIIQEGKSLYPHTIFIKSGYNRKEQQMRKLETVDVIKEMIRFCHLNSCSECPLKKRRIELGLDLGCNEFKLKYPEITLFELEKWANEHPEKTLLSDFKEKYPNAPLDVDDGTPIRVCPHHLGYEKRENRPCCEISSDCLKCWSRPLEEV